MASTFHVVVDAMLKRIRRSPLYYERYNNTHSFRINQAYVRFARECSARYAAEHGKMDLPPSPLTTNAATCLRGVFPPDRARAYSEKITEMIARNDEHVNRTAGEENLAVRILSTLQVFGPGLLDLLRSPDVHRGLLQFFRGHYRVHAVMAIRTFPADNIVGSWLWHSDSLPPHICKLFLHLTPANADMGATDFMNREDTMAYRRAGYFGQYLDERYANLEEFAKAHHVPYRPFHFDAEPGDATLFDMNCFHRAIRPKKGFRDIVQFVFLPSPIPWEEHYKRDIDRLMVADGGYPKDPRPGTVASARMM